MGSKSNSKSAKGSKHNVTKANGGKFQSQESQIENEANGEPHTDFSMLRKPIDISVSGVSQVVKVYQSGTTEVRQLLAYECDLVYECKVCRNLFRSLANFVSHKRVYCREQFSDAKHVLPAHRLVEDSTVVIQQEPVPPDPTETWVTSDATPDPSADDSDDRSALHIEASVPRIAAYPKPKRDLSDIIERLSQKTEIKSVAETVGHISASKFYETISEEVAAQRDAHKEHVICLEGTENTKFGVFQTVLPSSSPVQMDNTDLMKAQVVELHNMMSANEATLGPDGQIEMLNIEGTTLASIQNTGGSGAVVRKKDGAPNNKTGSSKENHVCSICSTRFSTRKTLNHHMKSLHVTFRMCYPCPCCKNTFCNTWSVYRHLYKVHRKTTIQVRKLRSQIVNKAFRKEVPDYESQNSNVKSGGIAVQSEADKARKEQQRLHQETQAWMNNFEDDLELQMCGGCGRRFERRAALNSHSQICQKRIAVQNNIKAYRQSASTSTTTSNRNTSTKALSVSTDRQHFPRTENTKNDSTCVESNTSRLTLVSVLSESMQSTTSGIKSITTPSPSPVSLDVSNQLLATAPGASYHRTRHCSGSWSDTIKKDIPEKRIEIQIRRDYCKTGAGTMSSVMGVGGPSSQQQDDNSETNENALSYDDTGEENDHDEVSNISNEDCEDHGGLFQPTEPDTCFSEMGPHLSYGKLDGSIGINVCSFTETIEKDTTKREEQTIDASLIDLVPAVRNVKDDESSTHSLQGTDLDSNSNQSEENTGFTDKNTTNFMRFIDKESTVVKQASDRGVGQDSAGSATVCEVNELQGEMSNSLDEKGNESVPAANTKKEDQFSPVMENRMQSMINIRRLQCLPCQKKFNKLTNLRRHVAVHIGWNRYQCTECTFKCFSKYDCVAHVIKMHLGKAEHDKAQTMVEYIETQISDTENDLSKCEPTEEPCSSHNNEDGQHMVQDTNINLSSKYDPASEDVEITVNDTNCNRISDWSLEEYDESKAIITGTSDYDTSIEAVPNNIHSSLMKLTDVEEHLYEYAVEDDRAKDAVMNIPVQQGPMIIKGDTNNSVATFEVKSGNVSETVVSNAEIILQEEERRKYMTSPSSLSTRLNSCFMNTEGLEHEEPESRPSKKRRTTTEYEQNIKSATALDFEQNECKPKMINVESETNVQNDPTPQPAGDNTLQVQNPSETQVQEQTALRKMVLEVIFGSGSNNVNHDLEATHNMLSMEVNGEHHHSEESASSPEPYDVVESVSCDSTSPLTSNSSAASPVLTSDDGGSVIMEETSSVMGESKSERQDKLRNSVSPVLETERRQRPVRNRIKVEREDFIYDLSDRCLDPRRDGDDRKVTKRKHEDRIRDSVKMMLEKGNCSGESSFAKVIPKVVLVRTNMGEYSGLRVVNKTGSANNMTQVFDSSSDKHSLPNTVGYNISTRKSQRIFDISPHKIPTVSKERHE